MNDDGEKVGRCTSGPQAGSAHVLTDHGAGGRRVCIRCGGLESWAQRQAAEPEPVSSHEATAREIVARVWSAGIGRQRHVDAVAEALAAERAAGAREMRERAAAVARADGPDAWAYPEEHAAVEAAARAIEELPLEPVKP